MKKYYDGLYIGLPFVDDESVLGCSEGFICLQMMEKLPVVETGVGMVIEVNE